MSTVSELRFRVEKPSCGIALYLGEAQQRAKQWTVVTSAARSLLREHAGSYWRRYLKRWGSWSEPDSFSGATLVFYLRNVVNSSYVSVDKYTKSNIQISRFALTETQTGPWGEGEVEIDSVRKIDL